MFPLLLLVILIIPVSTLVMIFRLYHNVPWGDHINLFAANRLQEGLTLSKLFRFHNEHQIVFTKLLIDWDYVMFHGSNILPYIATTFSLLGICGFYCWMLQRFGNFASPRHRLVACGLIVMLYFNGRMLWTITFPILFEHPSTALFALCAFFAFCRLPFALTHNPKYRAQPHLSSPVLVITLVAGYAAAAISSASGVLVGPAIGLAVCAFLIGSRQFSAGTVRKTAAVALTATVIVAGVYVGAYRIGTPGAGLQPRALHLLADIKFLILFVGAAFFRDSGWPVSRHADPFAMYAVAALFWLLLVWIAAQLFRRRESPSSFEIFHVCVILFVLLTAAVGGIFRADLSSLEAINKKYASNALLAWASAASLLIYWKPGTLFGKRPASWNRPLVICAAAFLLLIPGDLAELRVWQDWERQVKEAASAAASGVYSDVLMKRFDPNDGEAEQVVKQFIAHQAYCYRQMPPTGYHLSERFEVVDASPPAHLAADITPLEQKPGMDGFTASGTSTTMAGSGFPSLLVTDSDSRVIGYGNISNVAPGGVPSGNAKLWFAAFRPVKSQSSGAVRVYAIDGGIARLAGELPVPRRPQAATPLKVSAKALLRVPDHTDYSLEFFNGVSAPLVQPPVRIPFAGEISIAGWAVDRECVTAAAGLVVLIDNKDYAAQTGLTRVDVAAYFKQPEFTFAGFSFKMPSARVGAGRHELRLKIYTNGGNSYLKTPVFPFFIE
jgi:hypothetical protein